MGSPLAKPAGIHPFDTKAVTTHVGKTKRSNQSRQGSTSWGNTRMHAQGGVENPKARADAQKNVGGTMTSVEKCRPHLPKGPGNKRLTLVGSRTKNGIDKHIEGDTEIIESWTSCGGTKHLLVRGGPYAPKMCPPTHPPTHPPPCSYGTPGSSLSKIWLPQLSPAPFWLPPKPQRLLRRHDAPAGANRARGSGRSVLGCGESFAGDS